MSNQTIKTTLLETGLHLLLEKGYNHTGIQEVLQTVGVPKGSFYHYFASKQEFGLAVLDHYVQRHDTTLGRFLVETNVKPLLRLRRYFEACRDHFAALGYREGCLVGMLSEELADQNETFRLQLEAILTKWSECWTQCLREAQQDGELPSHFDPSLLAQFCLNTWEGTLLRMKVSKSSAPIDTFMTLLFGSILKT
jgi:TetR/AcrR family transcriptional repressor of nem operon